ncbi:uncharacterized protein MYCFIDRAFT_170351 [Pseudocercospora fijiensis CIRAD86]|uniref:F-box domain-containing protein n=1 Tax=Pseudocercospora fijiensis (strain CIRAD86) TaxID=383855 RepID=N1Q7R0_PSEFD|nr:uncharacterized protein MYCFIDRAFT_170351 [Pseudocercospora fijiensis CIRAD86]EME88775.1 hypothetical protein MYCFIDRAFT_170351 [Pseudocercospora fijiensis CIRAD86]
MPRLLILAGKLALCTSLHTSYPWTLCHSLTREVLVIGTAMDSLVCADSGPGYHAASWVILNGQGRSESDETTDPGQVVQLSKRSKFGPDGQASYHSFPFSESQDPLVACAGLPGRCSRDKECCRLVVSSLCMNTSFCTMNPKHFFIDLPNDLLLTFEAQASMTECTATGVRRVNVCHLRSSRFADAAMNVREEKKSAVPESWNFCEPATSLQLDSLAQDVPRQRRRRDCWITAITHRRQSDSPSSATSAMIPKPTQENPTKPKQEHFRLLDLPPELVVRIVEYAVITSSKECPLEFKPDSAVQPAITRACRLLRAEGVKLFYGSNYFVLNASDSETEVFWQWYACIGRQQAVKIDSLFVRVVDSSGNRMSLLGLQWDWWVTEVAFLRSYMAQAGVVAALSIQMAGEKVAMYHSLGDRTYVCYQISFKDRSGDAEGWRGLRAFPRVDLYHADYDEDEMMREDWWTWQS